MQQTYLVVEHSTNNSLRPTPLVYPIDKVRFGCSILSVDIVIHFLVASFAVVPQGWECEYAILLSELRVFLFVHRESRNDALQTQVRIPIQSKKDLPHILILLEIV